MSSLALIVLIALSAAAALVIAGQVAEARRTPTSQAERDAAPGRIVRLTNGRTYLKWDGPADGPVLVCVHGLSTPSEVWSPLVDRLTAAGFRVLRYDHYGRGLSDAPLGRYDARFYTSHLAELLDTEGIDGPVMLIGYSMGGSIVTAFAERFPDRCRGLVLLASGGLRDGSKGFYGLAVRLPVLGDALWSLRAPGLYRAGARAADTRNLPEYPGIVAREISRRGALPAQLASLRHMLADRQDALHARIAARGLPVLAVWGGRDYVIPLVSKTRLLAANPDARILVLPDATHELAFTHPDTVAGAVAEAVTEWLTTDCGRVRAASR